ncbi:MAG: hypothetical protein ACE5EX_10240 [Phycisphaerae bacterium]
MAQVGGVFDSLAQFVRSLPGRAGGIFGVVSDFFKSLPGRLRDLAAGAAPKFSEALNKLGDTVLAQVPSFNRLQAAISALFGAFPPGKAGQGGKEPSRNKVNRSSPEIGLCEAFGPHDRVIYFGAAPKTPDDPNALPLTQAARRQRKRRQRQIEHEIAARERGERGINERARREAAEEVRRLRREGREVRPSDRRRIEDRIRRGIIEEETRKLREERERIRRELEEDRRIREARRLRKRGGAADPIVAAAMNRPLDFQQITGGTGGAGGRALGQITNAAKKQEKSAGEVAESVRELRGDFQVLMGVMSEAIAIMTGAENRLAGAGGRVA